MSNQTLIRQTKRERLEERRGMCCFHNVIYHQAVLRRLNRGKERERSRELWGLQTDGSILYLLIQAQ